MITFGDLYGSGQVKIGQRYLDLTSGRNVRVISKGRSNGNGDEFRFQPEGYEYGANFLLTQRGAARDTIHTDRLKNVDSLVLLG